VALQRSSRRALDVAVRAALGASLALLLGIGLLPRTGWYRPVTVLSGSMQPSFSPGDIVVLTPQPAREVRAGQVISYRIPVGDHHVQTHRVIKVVRGGDHPVIRTKGDANGAADPWSAKLRGDTAWRVRLVLPKLGWALFWLRTPTAHNGTVFGAPLLLLLLGLWQIWRRPKADLETTKESRDVAATVN
jgi:signal peptidase